MASKQIGTASVIGLGNMGWPMAVNLKGGGFVTLGFDPSAAAQKVAQREAIDLAPDVAAAFAHADVVVLSLPNAGVVGEVVMEGLAALDGPAPLVIDASTSTAEMTRVLAPKLAAAGGAFLDAPVSGGPSGSRAGTLTFMVGGAEEDVARARPVFDLLGDTVLHAGPAGAGNIAKLVNNLMVAAHMLVAREGLALAQSAGLDAAAALDVVNAASGGSTVTQVHVPTWVLSRDFDSGFTMALMRKDVGLAMDLAAAGRLALPISGHVAELWTAEDAPGDDEDFTRMGDPQVLLRTIEERR